MIVPRPQLLDVDAQASPPTMTVAFPGEPPRVVTLRMRTRVHSPGLQRAAAHAEIASWSAEHRQLIYETARPDSRVTLVEEEQAGPVLYCPRCRTALGPLGGPALPLLLGCPGCSRTIAINVEAGRVTITILGA